MIDWPPHSLDLSPIEMVWSIIKRKLNGERFRTADKLFSAFERAWDEIPQELLDNLVGRFLGGYRVCIELNGACLNGHWRKIHQIHHTRDPVPVPEEQTEVEMRQ
jgi:hypothetical protein